MKNLYDVLKQKELELQQLQKEIEALRLAARLLSDDSESESLKAVSAAQATSSMRLPSLPRDPMYSAANQKQFP